MTDSDDKKMIRDDSIKNLVGRKTTNGTILGGVLTNNMDSIVVGKNVEIKNVEKNGKIEEERVIHNKVYRRYGGIVLMSTKMRNKEDAIEKYIVYEIGNNKRIQNVHNWLKINNNDINYRPVNQAIRTNELISGYMQGIQRKFMNNINKFEFMDLSGLVYQMARGIAKYNLSGTLTGSELRSNKNIKVRVLSTVAEPVTSSTNRVLIPRTAELLSNPAIFFAMVCATNAYGIEVITDNLEVTNNNAPELTAYTNASLARGCYDGIRMIMSMYDQLGEGTIIAMAMTKGLHALNTVVAHSDEGGCMRSVLRSGDYPPPYGGIYPEVFNNYTSMPIPNSGSKEQFTACVDSILLSTAALVAISDPCITIDGRIYPTILSNPHYIKGDKSSIKNMNRKINDSSGEFVINYIKNLGQLFCTEDNSGKSKTMLSYGFQKYGSSEDRHGDVETAAPFFWIEPTSIINYNYGSIASLNGYGELVRQKETVEVDAIPKIYKTENTHSYTLVHYEHRSNRTVPLLNFLNLHPDDGLANICPKMFDHNKVVLKGGNLDIMVARDDNHDQTEYMWGRGQSQLCAPAENVYIGKCMSSVITHFHEDKNNFRTIGTHMYSYNEMMNGKIKMTCIKPGRINDSFSIMNLSTSIMRKRTKAAAAIDNAQEMNKQFGMSGGEMFVPSSTEFDISMIIKEEKIVQSTVKGEAIIETPITSQVRAQTNSRVFVEGVHKVPLVQAARTSSPIEISVGTPPTPGSSAYASAVEEQE